MPYAQPSTPMKTANPTRYILIYGPDIVEAKRAYGGGTGGYTRNMSAYLKYFHPRSFVLVPCFHTFRGQLRLDNFLWRFTVDTYRFLSVLLRHRIDGVHILGQYRTAIPREFMAAFLAGMFRKPFVYELKAGAFIGWYTRTNRVFRLMAQYVLRRATIVLSEGMPVIPFLQKEVQVFARYFPNYVPSVEVPDTVPEKLGGDVLKVLFVGYCYSGKGIFELVSACRRVASHHRVVLTIIGQEHSQFTSWLATQSIPRGLHVQRLGKRSHADVLTNFQKNDIYCYPTRHEGEGHNNTINEAMMMGMVIVTTRQGFLSTIINSERGYPLEDGTVEDIVQALEYIAHHKEEARQKAKSARQYLIDNFTSEIVYPRLERFYDELLSQETTAARGSA